MKRRLDYCQISKVFCLEKGRTGHIMQQLPPTFTGEVPRGFYQALNNAVILPKKKRGDKFVVRYTQMMEKEF